MCYHYINLKSSIQRTYIPKSMYTGCKLHSYKTEESPKEGEEIQVVSLPPLLAVPRFWHISSLLAFPSQRSPFLSSRWQLGDHDVMAVEVWFVSISFPTSFYFLFFRLVFVYLWCQTFFFNWGRFGFFLRVFLSPFFFRFSFRLCCGLF